MSTQSIGGTLLSALRSLLILILKIIAMVFAWVCKLSGTILLWIGDRTFKIIEK